MSVPEAYVRLNAYTDWSANHPGDPHPGQDFDEDFDAISQNLREIIARASMIQRDDGSLADGVITSEDQFEAEFLRQFKQDIASSMGLGIQGPAGPQGVPGPIGMQGPVGPPLPWIVSTGVPSSSIGISSQIYLNISNGDVYQKGSSSWTLLGNIRGPAGVGGGGVTDHGLLVGLSDPDHPISAVQGLQQALDALEAAIVSMGAAQRNVYRQAEPPTANLNAGDLWIETDRDDRLWYWDGTQWVDVADKRISTAAELAADAIAAAAGAQATADGKVTTFFGSSLPVGARLGDLWIRSDQQNRLYRYNGTQWVNVQDGAIQDAIMAAADARAIADGKIETFFQPTAPIGASLGDLWFDTDDNNHQYRFNGAQWVSVRDQAIAQAAASAAQAITTASQALNQVETIADGVVEVFYQASPPVSAGTGDLWINTSLGNQLHRYNGTQWVSVQDTALQTALTNAQLAMDIADGKIRAFYTTNPPASGMSTGDLWYDTDDQFRPYRYTGSAWQDISFIQGVSGGLITGVSIANGAVTADKIAANQITASHLQAGVVNASHMAANSITAANGAIANGTITSAKIASAAIQNAHIQNLSVDTLKIASNAVTNPVSAFTAADITCSSFVETVVQSITINSIGSPVHVFFSVKVIAVNASPFQALGFVRVYRSGALLAEVPFFSNSVYHSAAAWNFSDAPGNGTHTYQLRVIPFSGDPISFPTGGAIASGRSLLALETKR